MAEIRRKHRATGTSSPQENLSDTLDTHRERVEDLRGRLPYPEGASGIAVTVNGRAVCLDVFDKPATLAEAMGSPGAGARPGCPGVRRHGLPGERNGHIG